MPIKQQWLATSFILFCISVADQYAISHVESKARFKDLFDRNAT